MLEVVENEQHVLRAQVVTQGRANVLMRPLGHAKDSGDGICHQRSIVECSQLHKKDPIFKIVAQRVRRFEREPRLADAARAGDG